MNNKKNNSADIVLKPEIPKKWLSEVVLSYIILFLIFLQPFYIDFNKRKSLFIVSLFH